MPKIRTTEKILDILKRSGLLDSVQLKEIVRGLKQDNSGALPERADDAASYLIEHEFITAWQAAKLLDGRYRGFFWDSYLFLEQHVVHDTYTSFIARDTTSGKRVLLAVVPPDRCDNPSGELRVLRELDD